MRAILLGTLLVLVAYLIATTAGGRALLAFLALAKGCAIGMHKTCDASMVSSNLLCCYYELPASFTDTAEAVARSAQLDGRVAIVTGASSGIGLEAARVLLKHGCKVILAVRSRAKGERLLATLDRGLQLGHVLELDVSDLDSVKAFVEAFRQLELPLHYLVNNAGIMGQPYAKSKQGYEQQFATNHLGHFLLTLLLEPDLARSGSQEDPSRAIFVASSFHRMWTLPPAAEEAGGTQNISQQMADLLPPTFPYEPLLYYSWTKALNVLSASAFQRRWQPSGRSIALALHPGIIATNLLTHTASESSEVPPYEALFMGPLFAWAHKSVGQGASTILYAMLAKEVVSAAASGKIYYENNALQSPSAAVLDADTAQEIFRASSEMVSPWL